MNHFFSFLRWVKKSKIRSFLLRNKVLAFLLRNKVEISALILLILLASFLRFYKLDEYMTFLGDEGRDALIIKRILTTFDIPMIGPPTSVGNMYLGPLYYYMMTPPMVIFWLNPVAAAGMVAFIGVLTVLLIYLSARVWFGFLPAVLAAFAYAVSPVTIIYSRSSWNPNPAPFFSLLAFLFFYKVHQTRNFIWLILTGIFIAAASQMHYLALILIPTFGILWLVEVVYFKKVGVHVKNLTQGSIGGILGFFFLMSPLLIFDLNNNFLNYKAFVAFFSKNNSVGFNLVDSLVRIPTIFTDNLIGRYVTGSNDLFKVLFAVFILFFSIFAIYQVKRRLKNYWPYQLIFIWILVGIFGLSFYKQEIYDHYLGFLNPAVYLLLAGIVALFSRKVQIGLTLFLILLISFLNLPQNPLLNSPNNQLNRTQEIAKFVINEAGNKPFNFALIAERNYDAAYQFYLEQYGSKPKIVPNEKTDQLFVVCEDPICKPINHPKYEIAGFGWAKIEKEDQFYGVKIFKLVSNPQGN